MEVHVLTRPNRHLYGCEVDEYHLIRHRIFIEEKKWRGLTSRVDGREYDQFDCDDNVYLLAIEDGSVVGGVRLLPTTAPHLLSDVFSHLASFGGIPRQVNIAESTRFFVVPERREGHGGSKVGGNLIASIMDYGLRERLSAISLVVNTDWLSKFRGYGWEVQELGPQDVHDGERIVAAKIAVTPMALAGVRKAYGLSDISILTWRGKIAPFVPGS
jgi:acyl-homoserine lactone synthase